jgi:hypothetical protein
MTPIPRTYYAKRLLEHGPLTAVQFREITGWKGRTPEIVLRQLCETGAARQVPANGGRYLYELS